ncbi:MAG: 6,7-dimethyl-8-ribityllumazine synthase [Bacteroidota bacterium]
MATEHHNLSYFNEKDVPNGADFKIGIVVSEWNSEITLNLLKGAKETLLQQGVSESNILIYFVPGTFELAVGAQFLFENTAIDGAIAIGVVIQGETKHFDFVCHGATKGIMDVSLKYNKHISFCVLTDLNIQQSIDRSGGKHGNKGVECAIAALKMIQLQKNLSKKS